MGKQLKIVLRGGGRKRKKSYSSKMHFLIKHLLIWGIWYKTSSYCYFGRSKCHQKNDDTKNGSNRMIKLNEKKKSEKTEEINEINIKEGRNRMFSHFSIQLNSIILIHSDDYEYLLMSL